MSGDCRLRHAPRGEQLLVDVILPAHGCSVTATTLSLFLSSTSPLRAQRRTKKYYPLWVVLLLTAVCVSARAPGRYLSGAPYVRVRRASVCLYAAAAALSISLSMVLNALRAKSERTKIRGRGRATETVCASESVTKTYSPQSAANV